MKNANRTDSEHPGKLKIFLGYASGVGKTHAMLEAGRRIRETGADIVVGYLAPNLSPDIERQAEDFEQLSPLIWVEHGEDRQEFDLDSALSRKPQLILVDELAHSNGPGSRHTKRYQDIQELLRAGINVFTTVNIQNLESLSDVVTSITGAESVERIPDFVLDSADQVEVVDMAPADLLERFRGETGDRTPLSGKQLAALREIALRRTADWLDRSTGNFYGAKPKVGERIMVCLSGAPSNAKVIRSAARLAEVFHSTLTALFVETPGDNPQSAGENGQLHDNLRLAEELGARIITVYGDDPATQISEYAKVSGISRIVIGRSPQKRSIFPGSKNLVDRLNDMAPDLDIYIIPDQAPVPRPRNRRPLHGALSTRDFMLMLSVLCMATAVGWILQQLEFDTYNIILVYLLGVLAISMVTTGRIYCLMASLLSVVIFAYLFNPPYFSFISDAGHIATFGVMFIVAFLSSSLTTRVKLQAIESANKAYRTEVLLETSRKLQTAEGDQQTLTVAATQLGKLLERDLLVFPLDESGNLEVPMFFPAGADHDMQKTLTDEEREVAEWVSQNNKHAGATTGTFPQAHYLYMAVRGSDRVQAVVGIATQHKHSTDAFEKNLTLAILDECGLALERERMARAKQAVEESARQEALRANLLRAISHDLRTPLTSIAGNAGILIDNGSILDEDKKHGLYTCIYDDAMWLNTLVQNLLSITRMENGSMGLKIEPELLDEVFTEALAHVDRRSVHYNIRQELEDDLLMADMDARLIVQVVINIVNNAIKYTPEGTDITVSAHRVDDMVEVSIADNGPGIPDKDKKQLFEMFYTANNTRGDGRRGLGLGLALCKSIILTHGGNISVEDNHPHGAVFRFTLRASEVMPYE